MKKIKCPRCFQTKSEKAFKEGAMQYEWCKDCREKFERLRRKQVEQKILAELSSLGLLRKKEG
jgi:transposase-like protein